MHALFFESGKETFGRRVVPAVSFAAHAANDPRFSEYLLVVVACILTASVAVQKQAARRIAIALRHRKSGQNKGAFERGSHRPPDDTPGKEIENDGEVKPALACRDVSEIATPFGVLCLASEFACQHVLRNGESVIAVGGDDESLGQHSTQTRKAHQAGNALLRPHNAAFPEFGVNSWRAVSPVTFRKDGSDALG